MTKPTRQYDDMGNTFYELHGFTIRESLIKKTVNHNPIKQTYTKCWKATKDNITIIEPTLHDTLTEINCRQLEEQKND